jgi:biotin transport system permease protein
MDDRRLRNDVVELLRGGSAHLTWDQALAVAARRLDGPEAWSEAAPLRAAEWGAGCLVALLAGAAAVLL